MSRVLGIIFLLILGGLSLKAQTPSPGGNNESNIVVGEGGGSVKQFAVKGTSNQGEYLLIDYFVPFPGMTKVKLFDGDRMVWRGQYVNEKGDHQLVLRGSKLIPGKRYTFHFSYKDEERLLPMVGR